MKKLLVLLPIFCVTFLSCEKEEIILEPSYIVPEFSEEAYQKFKKEGASNTLNKSNRPIYYEDDCNEYQDEGKDIIWSYRCYENFTGNSFIYDPIIRVRDVLNRDFECDLRFELPYPCDVETVTADYAYRPIPTAPNYDFGALQFNDRHNITHAELDNISAEILSRANSYVQQVQSNNGGNWFLSKVHIYKTEWAECDVHQKQMNSCMSPSTFLPCGHPTVSHAIACTTPVCEARGVVLRFEVSKFNCKKGLAPVDGDN